MSVVYDAGALIAADRSDRQVWAEHRARLELGLVPVATATVVAQVSRSPQQVQLRRFLRGCQVVPFTGSDAHDVGVLAGRCGVDDVIDVHVVLVAARTRSTVLTGDSDDLRVVADALETDVSVNEV